MDPRKILVLVTAAAAFFAIVMMASIPSRPRTASLEASNPIFGDLKAPIEVVIFEDLKCHGCRAFSDQVLPRIESEYLVSDRIFLKVVPLGFLAGSKVLANAALEVYRQLPESFLGFTKLLFDRFEYEPVGDSASEILLGLAREVGDVDLVQLKACIDQKCHYSELDHNLAYAKSLMGKRFRIPALYINGVRVSATNYQAIRQEIEKAGQ